jgi:hypothetical protein
LCIELTGLSMCVCRFASGAAAVAIFTWAPFMFCVYYLSEMYQAVYDTSATTAGIDLLPQIVVQIAVLIITGRIIARFGKYVPSLCFQQQMPLLTDYLSL